LNALVERFAKLPRSQRAVVAALAYLVLAALGYFAVIGPVQTDIESADSAYQGLVQTRNEVKARADTRAQLEADLAKITEELKQALTELPNDREIPGLLSEIDGLARRSGLEVRRFQPLPEVMAEYYAEVPVQIVMDGSYHKVANLFDRVRKMNRIVAIQDVDLSNAVISGSETNLTITGKAVTFRFLTEEEIAASRKAKKRDRKGGDGGAG